MSKRSSERQAELKANYKKLRAAGFSSVESSRLRSAAEATIKSAIRNGPSKFRELKPLSAKHAKAGGGAGKRHKKKETYKPAPPSDYKVHKGRIKKSDYEDIHLKYDLNEGRYAYKFYYVTVDKDGVEIPKYFTIIADSDKYIDEHKGIKVTKPNLVNMVWDEINDPGNISYYQAKPIKRSIQLIGLYHYV